MDVCRSALAQLHRWYLKLGFDIVKGIQKGFERMVKFSELSWYRVSKTQNGSSDKHITHPFSHPSSSKAAWRDQANADWSGIMTSLAVTLDPVPLRFDSTTSLSQLWKTEVECGMDPNAKKARIQFVSRGCHVWHLSFPVKFLAAFFITLAKVK